MPNELNLSRTFFLISGIINALIASGWLIYTLFIGAFTCGIGCLFGFLPAINLIACVMDFVAYMRLTNLDRAGIYNSIQFASIFDIITFLTGNPVSGIFGIINLINLNNDKVKQFLTEKGIY